MITIVSQKRKGVMFTRVNASDAINDKGRGKPICQTTSQISNQPLKDPKIRGFLIKQKNALFLKCNNSVRQLHESHFNEYLRDSGILSATSPVFKTK